MKEELEQKLMINAPQRIFWLALLLGWGFDVLFYGKQIGLSLVLFVLLILGVLWEVGRREGQRPLRHNLWLILPLIFFALMSMIRANEFLTFFNVVAVLVLLSYVAFFYAAGRVSALSLLGAVLLPARVAGDSVIKAAPVVSATMQSQSWGNGRRQILPILRGILLALPVLIIFTALLASADLVFADYIDKTFGLDFWPDAEWFWRAFLIMMVGWLLAGGLVIAISRQDQDDERSWLEKGLQTLPQTFSLGFVETMTVLLLVNLLFVTFTAVQFVYLFGGESNINIEGYTYADYARRGFFELVMVAVLSLMLILGLNWLTRRDNKKQIKQFNGLATLLIGLVMIMLFSAFRRMQIYETTFGSTELRLYVLIFIGWLGLLLGWFILTLWQRPDRFAIGVIACAIGFFVTVNLINPDAFIVQRNMALYEKTGYLDIYYLIGLSDDAVPGLVKALPLLEDDPQQACQKMDAYGSRIMAGLDDAYCQDETMVETLQHNLNGRYTRMETDTSWRRWQSLHLSRMNAYKQLAPVSELIDLR